MPRVAVETNSRVALRIRPNDKARLLRAVAIEHTDLTDFILRNALARCGFGHRTSGAHRPQ